MDETVTTEKTTVDEVIPQAPPGLRQDLAVLMKVRLNFFILITTFFGFVLAMRGSDLNWMKLLHTILGTAAAAFGSASDDVDEMQVASMGSWSAHRFSRPARSAALAPLLFVISP